jgi:GNAT superfamily N-acetyltransferase
MELVTVAERPDLLAPGWERAETLPEYNSHGDVLGLYWGRLCEERPEFQFHLIDGRDEILARVHTIPLRWDETIADLPAGIDGAITRGFQEGSGNALCALLVEVSPDAQRRGVSRAVLEALRDVARAQALTSLIAPVRPSFKERYPLVPIERYATWRGDDGELFDPWMRVHERLGATILKPEPHSLRITGRVAEWESWTQMTFPESGEYWFPGGLSTVVIDREDDCGRYWEPNVWMLHSI